MRIHRYLDPEGTIRFAAAEAGRLMEMGGDPYDGLLPTGRTARLCRMLAPVAPSCIIGIGLNYRKHAEEQGARIPAHPVVFMKSPGAAQDPDEPIVLPRGLRSDKVDYEGELAFVIGRPCKNVAAREALDYVLGFTVANDVSARDWQMEWGGRQWCRGKTFDTFCPFGPCLVTPDELGDPQTLELKTTLNGALVQETNTSDMIFGVAELIEFLSGSTTLLPGTLVITGTPSGVGMAHQPPLWLRAGDVVSIEIERIGVLTNPVVDEVTALQVSHVGMQ